MDSHVTWLRAKIISSVVKQSVLTAAIGAVVALVLLLIFTGLGVVLAVVLALVIGLAITVARVLYSMQNNPLNYRFMRQAVDRPSGYEVARFDGQTEAHRAADDLPGFEPVATIRNNQADPPVVIDVYHNEARLVAATVNRSSGATGLITSLAGGRFLLTDAWPQPPHERLVMNSVRYATMQETLASHQNALAVRADVVSLEDSAHQVVLESLKVEHESYVELGPTVAPFLDLYRSKSRLLSLIAKIDRKELAQLPVELGPDIPSLTAPRAWTPQPVTTISMADDDEDIEADATRPDVALVNSGEADDPAPADGEPQREIPNVVAPQVVAPKVDIPEVIAPVIAPVEIAEVAGPVGLPQREPVTATQDEYAPIIADASQVSLPHLPANSADLEGRVATPGAATDAADEVADSAVVDPGLGVDAVGLPVRDLAGDQVEVAPVAPEIVPADQVVELYESVVDAEPVSGFDEALPAATDAADEVADSAVVDPGLGVDAVGLPVRDPAGDQVEVAPVAPEIVPADQVVELYESVVDAEPVSNAEIGEAEIVGAQVVAADVVGAQVVAADVVGAQVVAAEVAGTEIVDAEIVEPAEETAAETVGGLPVRSRSSQLEPQPTSGPEIIPADQVVLPRFDAEAAQANAMAWSDPTAPEPQASSDPSDSSAASTG